jgi:methionyl-tRNA synthetase
MSKSLGNTVDLAKVREIVRTYSLDALRYYVLRAAPFGSDLDWTTADFTKAFNELANVLGNCLNRTVKMVARYRGGVLPAAVPGELEDIDRALIERMEKLGGELAGAYERCELQHCALLPLELARATNGYIDATAPFSLAKDPAETARLDTVLNVSAQAVYRALAGFLPVLPHKAAEGLAQLGVDVKGKLLPDLLGASLPAGQKVGEGRPLFPRVE